jgi:hypothetical protein
MNPISSGEELGTHFVDRTTMNLFFDTQYTTRQKKPSLKALVVLTDLKVEELPAILSRKTKLSRTYHVNISEIGADLYSVSLMRTMGLRQIRNEAIIDSANNGAWIVLTNAESYFIVHVLERFVDKLYPIVSRLYLNYSQMRHLQKRIREAYHGKSTATFVTIKREKRSPTGQRVPGQRRGTMNLWEMDADEEIKRLLDDGYVVSVDRLDFQIKDEKGAILLQAQITRKGLCKLRFGTFSAFYNNVILRAIDFGLGCNRFYDKRERNVKEGEIKLYPLQIRYQSVFDKARMTRYAKKISNAYSCSIIHGGNPYFAGDLYDCEDGSSFGVAILGDVVTITPATNVTPQGVSRLLSKTQEILGDGEIVDVKTG